MRSNKTKQLITEREKLLSPSTLLAVFSAQNGYSESRKKMNSPNTERENWRTAWRCEKMLPQFWWRLDRYEAANAFIKRFPAVFNLKFQSVLPNTRAPERQTCTTLKGEQIKWNPRGALVVSLDLLIANVARFRIVFSSVDRECQHKRNNKKNIWNSSGGIIPEY